MEKLRGTNPVPLPWSEFFKVRTWPNRKAVEFTDDRGVLRGGTRIGDHIYASTKNGPFRWEVAE